MYRLIISAICCTMLFPLTASVTHARGDFSKSCTNIKYNDGILTADCKKIDGITVGTTSINLNSILYWRNTCSPLLIRSDNCFYIALGQPTNQMDVTLSGFNANTGTKKFNDLKYWFSNSKPLLLYGRGCDGGRINCSESSINLDAFIANIYGTLKYVP